jgi:hypothetical protein
MPGKGEKINIGQKIDFEYEEVLDKKDLEIDPVHPEGG